MTTIAVPVSSQGALVTFCPVSKPHGIVIARACGGEPHPVSRQRLKVRACTCNHTARDMEFIGAEGDLHTRKHIARGTWNIDYNKHLHRGCNRWDRMGIARPPNARPAHGECVHACGNVYILDVDMRWLLADAAAVAGDRELALRAPQDA